MDVYTSRFSICLLKSKEDVQRISEKVSFNIFVPFESSINADEYAILEFNIPHNRKNTLMLLMLKLMTTGSCMIYRSEISHELDIPVYLEKTSSNSSITSYVNKLFRGCLTDSRYVALKLYWFCHPNEMKGLIAEVEKSKKFVNKMCHFYRDLKKKRIQNATTGQNS